MFLFCQRVLFDQRVEHIPLDLPGSQTGQYTRKIESKSHVQ
jgi:hypothetical protein